MQDELQQILHGRHEVFEEKIAELEEQRCQEIQRAMELMEYRIQCADQLCEEAVRSIEDDTEVKRKEPICAVD